MKFFGRQKQSKNPKKKGGNELQLALLPNSNPSQRKIIRWQTVKIVTEENRPQNEEQNNNNSVANVQGSSLQQTTSITDTNSKPGKLEESLPRFGPWYGRDQPVISDTKEKALEHVLKKTSDDTLEAKEIYFSVVRRVEHEARDIYADTIECPPSEFLQMMIQDGCFFLQLSLLILGRPELLGYPSNHIFGRKPNKKESKKWMESMFFVGNQIPLVILKELMGQAFFKDVIARGKWDPPPSNNLCKKVLYELLVLPAKKGNGRNNRRPETEELKHSDLLHGLHDLVIGPGSNGKKKSGIYEAEDDFDLEANEGLSDGNRINQLSVADINKRLFPSATELDQSGICIARLKKGGVRGICFNSYYFWATLYLPALPIDDDVEIVFRNLKTYETSQQLEKHKREVCSYLRMMSDFVQTSKDVKLLHKRGIIQGSPGDEDELPEMLGGLSSEVTELTHDFHVLRRKIRDYSGPPWARIKSILNVVAVLTLIQTVFSVLTYFRPPRQR